MKGDSKVIEYLNQVLTIELTSINQYFLHARMYKNWGFEALDKKCFKKSIKDMKQADELIERVLFLEGLPNLQKLNRLRIGESPAEMLQCDMDQIVEQLALLREAIAYCESVKDFVSREVLEEITEYEEEHLDWIETQQHLIANTGIENYLQSMMSDD
ncbi:MULTISPECIES: bacterioferritin [unclassified Oceanobacter]|jgi:bacterioferritin|uniref:bacterioferritin n=2 Tax=Gammaproteobacteria TaxID=1236 RepID=UPI0026E3E89A|nr:MULTISPECIES: bacterioferritin [unclassified Oceanobacter]MDO6682097.1 bacterioferritin [Oceanobacter sp. 5_MG-2023]MDP2505508.1 bacterioferritin [Oceanobacter sp. 3_MG-2023]MDP2547083.1 bacterioferritin [Oceanobacter sp. 4_MG-2023]MDP2609708.1 bacterioferritin [Oceanobacter sp. 1_MG-2023]MDP2613039.1 bacterioferritin [Oceanobacter sp. 2_MG-2023]